MADTIGVTAYEGESSSARELKIRSPISTSLPFGSFEKKTIVLVGSGIVVAIRLARA